MSLENEAWFIHAVSENVTHLAQQKKLKTGGTMRVKEGVVGKTHPFQIIDSFDLQPQAARDADTVYLNPNQTKRRATLRDFAGAVLIDDFDTVKTLTNPQSEFAMALGFARARKQDALALSAGLLDAGGIIGLAQSVDEAAESTGSVALPSAQIIEEPGTELGLTIDRVLNGFNILANTGADPEDFYIAVSPTAIKQMLQNALSRNFTADYHMIKAIMEQGSEGPVYGFKWRISTLLPLTADPYRLCMAWAKNAVGAAFSNVKTLEIDKAVHKNNAMQVLAKLSGGVVRIDDTGVVAIEVDETVVPV